MHRPVDRQFYTNPESTNKSHFHTPSTGVRERLVGNVANSIIGKDKTFCGPYGQRQVIYLDYTASGRSLSFIEDYIQREVLPEYGNTHTTTSVTSLQTTLFRHEARDIIRNAVNASEHDSVIFTGSGTTGAVHKLIHALDLKEPPVVFVGPHEHHSNLLPWKEISAETWGESDRRLIGSFSAASNVTGILCDADAVTVLLHRYGALAFWDYATAAPYVRLDMNPVVSGKDVGLVYKDAMFFSPHKFVGGVNTPGVLVAKKKLFQSDVPHQCGGGTVFYVRREAHRYLREPELKEEGGTPNIVGAIRAGLAFQLKSAITPDLIMHKEREMFRRAMEAWGSVPNLVILGSTEVERLPIFSFVIHDPASGLFLHHNYVSALLNDLFGIQARGGCACAGPYAMDLLGLTEEKAAVLEELLAEDSRLDRVHLRRYMEYSHREILRPGFTRLNLPYFLSQDQLDFVLQAVTLVAQHGWRLLPQYMFNPETGEWQHRERQVFKERKWLGHISYASGQMEYSVPKVTPKAPLPQTFEDCLETAKQLFSKAEKSRTKLADQTLLFDEEARPYRWFLLPSEASGILSGARGVRPRLASSLPFCPHKLLHRLGCTDGAVSPSTAVAQNCATDPDTCAAAKTEKSGAEEEGEKRNCDVDANDCSQSHNEEARSSKDLRIVDIPYEGLDIPEEAEENLPVAFRRTFERRHGDGFRGGASSNGTSHAAEGSPSQTKQDVTGCGDSEVDKVAHTLVVDGEGSMPSASVSENSVRSQESGGKLTTKMVNLNVSVSESDTKTDTDLAACSSLTEDRTERRDTTSKTDSEPGSTAQPESKSDLNDAAPSDSSQDKTSDSGYQDPVPEPDSGVSGAAAACSESSQCVPSDGEAKSKKKKKKKRKGDGGQCTLSGACGLRIPGPEPARKEVEVGGNRWVPPSKEIFAPAVKALEEFSMIKNGDRVLVCVSGGKDSLSLLHTIRQYQFYCRSKGVQFEFGAVTVDPQTSSYDPSPLKQVMADLGVPYFYESQGIMETAVNLPYECASICSFCSRLKRGRIYAAARQAGYSVVALGQHLDDLAESFMMSLFHNGSLRTMKAHYTAEGSGIRVIRPFVYVREKDLRYFAEKNNLPVIAENCPACFEAPKERHRTKQLLASQEVLFPRLYSSLQSAIKPIMSISHTGRDAGFILNKFNQEKDYLDFKFEL
ncbi:hypothetical protein ACOMHN_017831 [Nucella lapillus]